MKTPPPTAKGKWHLRLYVAGQSQRTAYALANLKQLCDQHLPGNYQLQVIDLLTHPALAKADQIVAIPTLVRTFPQPVRTVLGDFSNPRRALAALDLVPPVKPL